MTKKLMISSVVLAALIVGGFFVWQLGPQTSKGPQTTGLPMSVGRYYWPGSLWFEIADRKGWFQEAGLQVELIDTNPDYYASLQDVAEGKIDTANFYLFDLMRYRLKGADLVAVLNLDVGAGADALVARKGINSLQELKGKTVGVPLETAYEFQLDIALERKGLRPGDVVKVNTPGEQAAEALTQGAVDAVMTWEPVVTEAIEKGQGRKLFDNSQVPGLAPAVISFHRSFIEERPGDVEAFVRVWHRTTNFIKESPKEAFGIIAEIYGVTPGEVQAFTQLGTILDLRDNLTAFTYAAGFESLHGTVRQINDFMIEKGITDQQLDSTEFLDARFIRRLK